MQFKKENILKAHKRGCEDVKKFIELAAPELFPKEKKKTYSDGDRFEHDCGDTFRLRTLDTYHRVGLICTNGSDIGIVIVFSEKGFEVKDIFGITEYEFRIIAGDRPQDFTLIED